MSIVSCEKSDQGRDARIGTDGLLEITESYIVVTDNALDDGPFILRAPCLPLRGETHPVLQTVYAQERECRQRPDSQFVWDVLVFFRETLFVFDNPLLDPPRIQYGTVRTREPYTVDVTGIPMANSAGQPFDPPPMRDVTRPTMTYTRNEPNYILGEFTPFYDGVNEGWFFGAAPGQAKIMNITGNGPMSRNGIEFWEVTYEVHFRRTPWWLDEILDVGLDELIIEITQDSNGNDIVQTKLRPITRKMEVPSAFQIPMVLPGGSGGDPDAPVGPPAPTQTKDIPITDPVFLDGQGMKLGNDQNGLPLPPVFLRAEPYHIVDFNDFPFGPLIEGFYNPNNPPPPTGTG